MLKQDICKKIIFPCCQTYSSARQIYNNSIQKFPSDIYYCKDEGDVMNAVCFAIKHDLTIRIRSGGHSYEGFCVGNGVLVIDISHLKSKRINQDDGTVSIGSGINNEELYEFLGQFGYPFASGTCPTVSAAGLTQGGGWGHSARLLGLTCDRLKEIVIVDANGNKIVASEKFHTDLFWAIRGGGGGNFGVITALKYWLPPKLFQVTYVDIYYHCPTTETALLFFQVWQEWLKDGDDRFTPNSRITNSRQVGLTIFLRGFFYGTPEETIAAIQPFLDISGAQASFQYMTFLEAAQMDASVYPDSEKFRFAGRFSNKNLTTEQIKKMLLLIQDLAKGAVNASIGLYALGGKVQSMTPHQTAFFYRDANYIIGIGTTWKNRKDERDNLDWMVPRYQYLRSITTGSYINFPYLCTCDYMAAYYGDNCQRLMEVKQRYDPDQIFSFAQSICI